MGGNLHPASAHPDGLPDLLRDRVRTVAGLLRGMSRKRVREDDVHHLRIAARRLQNTLLLAFHLDGRRRFRTAARRLGRLAAAAGEIRDLDVQARFLETCAGAGDRRLPPLLDRLRRRLSRQRSRLADRFAGRLAAARKRLRRIGSLKTRSGRTDAVKLHTRLDNIVTRALDAFLAAAETARNTPSDAALHRWRLATKRLRYRLEALEPLRGNRDEPAIHSLAALQTRLGEAHDAAVFQTVIRQLAAREQRHAAALCGIRTPLTWMKLCVRAVLADSAAAKHRATRAAFRLYADTLTRRHWPAPRPPATERKSVP